MATNIDGQQIARRIEDEVDRELKTLSQVGVVPSLVAVQAGDDKASVIYLRRQQKAATRLGIGYRIKKLGADVTEPELLREIGQLNRSPDVTGILVQMPLPPQINPRTIRRALHPDKDVEGVHPQNLGRLLSGGRHLVPCTAAAAFECLRSVPLSLEGREAVVVGHSETVGKPVALLLMEQLATVTVCHHGTQDVRAHTRRAEVLVVAVGKPGLVHGDDVLPGAVVVDIGINEVEREGRVEVVGDVDAASVGDRAGWLTPVPGGVGPVTVAMLFRNTVRAVSRQGTLPV